MTRIPMLRTTAMIAVLALPASPALAEDALLLAPPAEVTVYAQGARIVARGEARLPAGAHRLLVPVTGLEGMPDIAVTGAEVVRRTITRALPVDPETTFGAQQAATLAGVEAARADLRAAEVALAQIQARIAGQEARIEVLRGAELGAENLASAAAVVAEGVAQARAAIAALLPALRAAEDARDAAAAALARAERRHAETAPQETAAGLILDVEVAEAGTVALEMTRLASAAGWEPLYDLRLDSGSGALAVERQAVVRQSTGTPWDEVDLTLSTARPQERLEPSRPGPDIAQTVDPDDVPRPVPLARGVSTEMAVEESALMDAAGISAPPVVVTEGFAVSYAVPGRVTVPSGPDGAETEIALATLDLEAEVQLRGAPPWDRTAFVIATAANAAETLIPGRARHWRDGAPVGERWMPVWAEGEELEIGFGPVETIRLERIIEDQQSGAGGFISRSSTREVGITLRAENTGSEPREVRMLYALPVSEEEALRIDVTATPAPDETDVDDVRGLAAWDLMLAPGEAREIGIVVDMDWPDDRRLIWAP